MEDNYYEFDKNIPPDLVTMTADNNILFYSQEEGKLCLWSMESKRVILQAEIDNDVS